MIVSSWSDNPRKGADILAWLDEHLDFDAYDVTFAGRTQQRFRRISVVDPLPSEPLADRAGKWRVCSPESVADFSAIGYFFARDLHKELGTPVGIVRSMRTR